jgi:hypothetical protein
MYLGRGGEFYTKPSKIYPFTSNGGDSFWVQPSFDGRTLNKLPYENFIIELALIVNSKRYQSEGLILLLFLYFSKMLVSFVVVFGIL